MTYGTFGAGADGVSYPSLTQVEADFAQIAANDFNTVRTYTVPPRWLLDVAARHGLYVMLGVPWEQHVAFLDDSRRARAIEQRLRTAVRACAGHPAVLGYAVGNEIPPPIVRWHGPRRVEAFVERLYDAAKCEDPDGLVTYVNFPTTEYLELPFADLVCFNVYLESEERLAAYLARLHNLAGDRPLILSEIGLDSRRHGQIAQARALEWQVRTAFTAGCAGAFVFAWTDEWHRGGHDIDDWDFGLTDRARRPKPALMAVRRALADVPFPKNGRWPRISVVVCSYNGSRTIRECLDGLLLLEYPNVEVIVVDDGSRDATAAIAREYPFRLIRTPNRGLSSARNTGLHAATGEIVAYIDDDAIPDPHWLTYLAATFATTANAGVGGPNIPPPDDGLVADCVANAPGGPIHVLLSDREAEHIPGCNMAFRKEALEAIGGFDPRFRTAGDDVDVCWSLQQRGWTLGFSPAAMVWHHRRNSVRAYWKQQSGYARAEALLEQKWPEKYNAAGHATWAGRLYGNGIAHALNWRRGRIYHGTWGAALFQSVYQPAPGLLASVVAMPEWYLVIAALTMLAALGALWAPLLWTLPALGLAVGAPVLRAVMAAARMHLPGARRSRGAQLRARAVVAVLHVLQPLARLNGRLRHGLTPWRRRGALRLGLPAATTPGFWSERWRGSTEWLGSIETALRDAGVAVVRGGDFDRWDLEIRGALGAARMRMADEEHGRGRQLIRFRIWPRPRPAALILMPLLAALAAGAGFDGARAACALFGAAAALVGLGAALECGGAAEAFERVLERLEHAVRLPRR